MNLENKLEIAKQEALKILQNSEDKAQAIIDAFEKITEAKYSDLINGIVEQSKTRTSENEYSKSLGLRTLSKEETKYYQTLIKDPRQAVTGEQSATLPTSIVDITLNDIKEQNNVLSDVNFAPADVKRWISAEKTGAYSWNGLTAELKGEIKAGFAPFNTELGRLDVYMIIPKAIRNLALPYVDKYFRAVLGDQLNEGLEYGYFQGNGVEQPIGIYKTLNSTNEDKTHQDKDVNTDLTSFKPKALAAAKKYLSNNGTRTLDRIILYCHPNDEADYVAPALYDYEGRLISSYKNLEVKTSVSNPEGKAALVIPKKYTMGLNELTFNEYDQTLALQDADLIVGQAYANGRATDDNIAYIFDVTKLEEYVPEWKEYILGA